MGYSPELVHGSDLYLVVSTIISEDVIKLFVLNDIANADDFLETMLT